MTVFFLISWKEILSDDIPSTEGHLHCEFVRLLFWETHRETDRFLTDSGIQLPHTGPPSSTTSLL
jgi:hypothetical protein